MGDKSWRDSQPSLYLPPVCVGGCPGAPLAPGLIVHRPLPQLCLKRALNQLNFILNSRTLGDP